MKKPKRTRTRNKTEVEVLERSRRRCALCVFLQRDTTIKRGQLAHIDRNRSNSRAGNLAFLCLPHHDEYDSKTRQSKGITPAELRRYKAMLEADPKLLFEVVAGEPAGIKHDRRLFERADGIFSYRWLSAFLDELGSDHSYHSGNAETLSAFLSFLEDPGNEFLDPKLRRSMQSLGRTVRKLRTFLSTHFFVFPEHQEDFLNPRLCLYPDHNIDRGGKGLSSEAAFYSGHALALARSLRQTESAYSRYRRVVKQTIYV